MELMKGSDDWNVFADIFNYFKRFYDVPAGDCTNPEIAKFWRDLVDEGNAIGDRYKHTDTQSLAERLVISVMNELELRSKKECDRIERSKA